MMYKLLIIGMVGCAVLLHCECKSSSDGDDSASCVLGQDLHQAASENRQDLMKELLKNGADINAIKAGSTILHTAASRGDVSAVQFMVANGINVGLYNNDGLTALHLAVQHGQPGVMKVLIAEGADVNARASDGSTLLHLAVVNDMKESVEFILKSNNTLVSPQNNKLFTPLVLAERLERSEISAILRERIGNISSSRLLNATCAGNLTEVKSLVFRGSEMNVLTYVDTVTNGEWGWAPVHRAAGANANMDILKFLVEHGADVNIRQSPYNRTPLYEASYYGQLETAKYLVNNGAEVNAICSGETALKVAKTPEMASYLRSVGGEM